MRLGYLGSGNMASALARGIGEPALCFDPVADRAQALASELGGEAVAGAAALAEQADVVVLGHKPGQLAAAAREAGAAKAVVSILGGVPIADLRAAYPGRPVVRLMPNTPAGVGKGVVAVAIEALEPGESAPEGEAAIRAELVDLLRRCATVVELPEAQMAGATAVFGVLPAYVSLFAEATVDAAVRHGMTPADAGRMVAAGIEGSAALLRAQDHDTLAVRRGVTSPGGSTARGLRALDRGGLREAVQDAFDAVVDVA
ncbi:pyrroline-5-carboxylate reductase dimerization domain-containing protein [Patulibacter sp. NPDC049589]|uniref:pyrroline-5-carboxylate reductase family protein n=1 Tax=Patulibacter sp. NPDC049589 TaxID=3154731 RepID=UPI003439588C